MSVPPPPQRDAPDCYSDGETSLQAEPELRRLGAEREAGDGRLCPCLPVPAPGELRANSRGFSCPHKQGIILRNVSVRRVKFSLCFFL